MGKVYDQIHPHLRTFIEEQPLFFVATAPLSQQGHVNVSPKGIDSLRILSPHAMAYLDLLGSGSETIAHVRENGRICLMFCALAGAPKIVRLHGKATVYFPHEATFQKRIASFPHHTGVRSLIQVECQRVSDSCGFGVPLFAFQGQRSTLLDWSALKNAEDQHAYIEQHNRQSIDGLPAVPNPNDRSSHR